MSRRTLAEAVGCRASAIKGLEASGDLGNWPHRLVGNLRSALGFQWEDLEPVSSDVESTDDDMSRIGAELARTGRVLEVDLQASDIRTGALDPLRSRLNSVGMAISELQSGAYHLVASASPRPLTTLLPDADPLEAFSPAEHQLLAEVLSDRFRFQSLSQPQRRLIGGLINRGHLRRVDGAIAIAGPLRTALGLSPEPEFSEHVS